jgi:helix-turn-helix protein
MSDLAALIERRRALAVELADVEAEIERQRGTGGSSTAGAVLTIEEAAQRLRTTVDALYRKRLRARIGYKDPLDGKIKFTEAELDDYARRHRRGA